MTILMMINGNFDDFHADFDDQDGDGVGVGDGDDDDDMANFCLVLSVRVLRQNHDDFYGDIDVFLC